jgi:hypothetical protein
MLLLSMTFDQLLELRRGLYAFVGGTVLRADVEPFLERREDSALLTRENLLAVLKD